MFSQIHNVTKETAMTDASKKISVSGPVEINGLLLEVSADGKSVKILGDSPVAIDYAPNRFPQIPNAQAGYVPGKMVQGKGIYIGAWTPEDRDFRSLGKTFNLFAAPEDLSNIRHDFEDTVLKISRLDNWHGHDGVYIESDTDLYDAIATDVYDGGWFMPTRDIVDGTNMDGSSVRSGPLFALRNTGDLKGTFMTSGAFPSYMSCTEGAGHIFAVNFANGNGSWASKGREMWCRPVRAELKP
jgi:hypothetical protein